MAIDFPNSPSPGANHTVDGKTWTFTDGKWALNVSVGGVQGPAGVAIQGTAPATTDVLWADTSVSGVAVIPAGGTTGQMLAKSSSASYDTAWATPVTSSDLALKAPLASPALTGTPTAPTATAATNTTQIATTAFVRGEVTALVNSATATLDTLGEIATALGNDANLSTTLTTAIGLKAPLASPALTGTPTAPTASAGTNTTQIATMASKPWNTAWGMQTYTTATANDLTITSEELQITGSSFTAVTGRLYKITYYEPELYGSTSYMQVNIRDTNTSGAIRQLHYVQINGNNNMPSLLIWIGTLTAGTTNFVATLSSYSGTGAAYRAANQVAYLAVEDIGPA